ncbi:MAG: hypothetical protein OFPI_22990 [Osedax symbiont Rs2]|nr:MAG: hypothetical protein OFPI_22990 [Osedax symbiont Rs2]
MLVLNDSNSRMNVQAGWRMKFREHGGFTIQIEPGLLLVDATGPFNDELLKRYNRALESSIQQLEASAWVQIISLHQTSLFTPEAESILTATLIERRSRGLQAGYLILEDVEFRSLVQEQLSRCYNQAGVAHQFFDCMSALSHKLSC